jgi:hypothetical protein
VPRLAFDLEVRPSRIVSFSEQRQPRRGYFLDPASAFVVHNFVLDLSYRRLGHAGYLSVSRRPVR